MRWFAPLLVFGIPAIVSAQAPSGGLTYAKALALGGRVDWSHSANLIAFDKPGSDGYNDLHVMKPNGTEKRCLTCGTVVSVGHAGNPAWDPTAAYIVFQVHDPALPIIPEDREPIASFVTSPGWGTNNNLWLTTADGSRMWQLTNIAAGMATLHPKFSASGSQLAWAERIWIDLTSEQWVMRVADLVWDAGTPRLANITTVAPLGADTFYETHGFLPGDSGLLFSAGNPVASSLDIFTYEFGSGLLRNLTNTPNEYDEHAHFSPDGTWIVWASSRGVNIPRDYFVPYTDYWVMNADGSGQTRLSYFNDPSAAEYYAGGIVAADISFGPDGAWMVGKLEGSAPSLGGIVEVIVGMK